MIFKIGNEDFTTCVVAESYAVNAYDVYSEWTDANYEIHRTRMRDRVAGTLSLYMRSDEDLKRWHKVWNNKRSDCRYEVTVSINNTGETRVINRMFIECEPERISVGHRDTLAEFELELQEA